MIMEERPMAQPFIAQVDDGFSPDPQANIFDSLLVQYKGVVVHSAITAFGLDFLIKDRDGGDVDTIHNVREGIDYKNKSNETDYNNRGEYGKQDYRSKPEYTTTRSDHSQRSQDGKLTDAYTGEILAKGTHHVDHVISAKEVHEDKGRILAGLNAADLANSSSNLRPTKNTINWKKNADSVEEYIRKHPEIPKDQQARMRRADRRARADYNQKINKAYYSSSKFRKDTAIASAKVGAKMGLRQVVGFVMMEVWFSVEDAIAKMAGVIDFSAIGQAIKNGFQNALAKYKTILSSFKDGAIAGVLSSLTTTLCNIFFTTFKNTVKVIRQAWVSLVEAFKIIFINPDNLAFEDRLLAVLKALATGASIVAGVMVQEVVSKIPMLSAIPVINEILPAFCGAMVTGILTISFLYFLDNSAWIKKLLQGCNFIFAAINRDIAALREQADKLTEYAAKLMEIDLTEFKADTLKFQDISAQLDETDSPELINSILLKSYEDLGIKKAWTGDFDQFMGNKDNKLVFE
jgi:hypothetical protein